MPISVSMTPPDASPVPVPVRVTPTMPSSSDEPHSGLLEPAPFNDIGTLLEPTRSIDDKTLGRAQDPRANGAWLSNFLTERSMKCLS